MGPLWSDQNLAQSIWLCVNCNLYYSVKHINSRYATQIFQLGSHTFYLNFHIYYAGQLYALVLGANSNVCVWFTRLSETKRVLFQPCAVVHNAPYPNTTKTFFVINRCIMSSKNVRSVKKSTMRK